MADKKITELTNITGANLVDADEFVVVDISADETKAITLGELKEAFDSGSGFVRITGDTMTGDLALSGADVTFGDNDKAIFGAGSDLQIYSDGTTGQITGDVNIAGTVTATGTSVFASLDISGDIDVDGTTNLDVVDIDGAVDMASTLTMSAGGTIRAGGVNDLVLDAGESGTPDIYLQSAGSTKVKIEGSNGNVGIGTTSPTAALDVRRVDADGAIAEFHQSGGYGFTLSSSQAVASIESGYLQDFVFKTGSTATEHMRITSSGSVGIGTSSPTRALHVNSGASNEVARFESTDTEVLIELVDTTGSAQIRSRNDLRFYTNGGSTRAMDIDSSGNVGIGTSSPNRLLSLYATQPVFQITNVASGNTQGTIQYQVSGSTQFNIDNQGSGSGGVIAFMQAGAERMRIDSSGNLLVGKTATGGNTAGMQIINGSFFSHVRDGGVVQVLNRKSSDGDILSFEKDNTSVGGIQTGSGGYMHIKGGNNTFGSGIAFNNQTWNPTNASGTITDNHVKLGDTGSRFTDLYLSGTAYVDTAVEIHAGNSLKLQNVAGNGFATIQNAGAGTNTDLSFNTAGSEAMRISGGNLLVGKSSNLSGARTLVAGTKSGTNGTNGQLVVLDEQSYSTTDNGGGISFAGNFYNGGQVVFATVQGVKENNTDANNAGALKFTTKANGANQVEAMRLDSSGNLLVGTTSSTIYGGTTTGINLNPDGPTSFNRASGQAAMFNRISTDGDIVQFRKDGNTVGSIGVYAGDYLTIGEGGSAGVVFYSTGVRPWNLTTNAANDDAIDLGALSARFDDIYATNGTIQTSDRNEKQDIEALSDAEQRVAVACKGLLRKFRWKDAVAEKGDDARIHFGIIAQDLQDAFAAEGLDAGDYAMFISSTWWEATETYTDDDGVEQTRVNTYETAEEAPEGATERTRLGVRYPELLAFIIAAI